MKQEPLKDKAYSCLDTDIQECNEIGMRLQLEPNESIVFKKVNIKSAVEWLKKACWELGNSDDVVKDYDELCTLINKAFEDVMK